MSSLVLLRCSVVPEYLRESAFYRNLDKNDDEEFSVPEEYFKEDTFITTDTDVNRLLSTLQFWGSTPFPESIIVHTMQPTYESLDEMVENYGECFPILKTMKTLRGSRSNQRMNIAIEHGYLEIVQYLYKQGDSFEVNSGDCAVKVGSIPILQFMHENGHLIRRDATRAAAGAGQLSCLQYLHSIGCPWNSEVGFLAARNGHLTCLKYVLENGHVTNRKWHLCQQAAQHGHHECLLYLLQDGCVEFVQVLVQWAAASGSVECLRIAYEYVRVWPPGISVTILQQKNLDCFIYSITNGCPYSVGTGTTCAEPGLLGHLQYIKEYTLLPFDEYALQSAVNRGNFPCVTFLFDCGFTWRNDAYVVVLEKGFYDCLVYMHEHGAAFGTNDCTLAARHGHLPCLQYLHTHGATWGVETCRAAASHDNLDCLMYLHENGCPWDLQTTMDCMYHEDCYCYAKNHGCPVP